MIVASLIKYFRNRAHSGTILTATTILFPLRKALGAHQGSADATTLVRNWLHYFALRFYYASHTYTRMRSQPAVLYELPVLSVEHTFEWERMLVMVFTHDGLFTPSLGLSCSAVDDAAVKVW